VIVGNNESKKSRPGFDWRPILIKSHYPYGRGFGFCHKLRNRVRHGRNDCISIQSDPDNGQNNSRQEYALVSQTYLSMIIPQNTVLAIAKIEKTKQPGDGEKNKSW